MIRSFLTVGQGACYLEQFRIYENNKYGRINIMYDCGSSSSLESLKTCLSDNLDDGETIHAVFISHFDEDHINGLPFLLEKYSVKNLFIPLITEEEKKILQLSCLCGIAYCSHKEFFDKFFGEYPYINGFENVYYVASTESTDNDFIPSGWDIQYSIIRSGENVVNRIGYNNPSELSEWYYVPFNFRQKSRYNELINELNKEFKEDIDLEKILYIIKDNDDNIEKFKKAYRKVTGSTNTNTMVLFSGTKNKNTIQRIYNKRCSSCYYPYCDPCCHFHSPSGCLYMGDYNASGQTRWQGLKDAFCKYWDLIGCVQIPHHGSKHSYNSELTDLYNCFYVISAGKKNQFRHPHSQVVKDMLFKGLQPIIVTEDNNSEAVFIVE